MKRLFALLLAAVLMVTMAACGGGEVAEQPEGGSEATVPLSEVYDAMDDILPDMMLMDEESMLNYYGVDAELCSQSVMAICADGLRADEVWLLEAKDADALQELKALAEGRLIAKEDETVNYLPEQYEIVKKAVLYTDGLYLVFMVSPDVDALKEIVDAVIA